MLPPEFENPRKPTAGYLIVLDMESAKFDNMFFSL